ncbi:DUF6058 family natural product biosynthesis protein [Pelagibacterium limicola]|uniref:DUF6058 family natural product biosynthesis protein n=1 Tax=Pelagibacterium limicola TaxID=2791022 RepID=UPI0018AFD489|nr:DUF6058 family natural product biosynthesis protein [Pelagibacterium limicola]
MLSAMLSRYLKTHFVDEIVFIQSSGITKPIFDGLIAARAIPGAIYRLWTDGTAWSPIGGWVGECRDKEPASEWFSPAAIWWARRANVFINEGHSPSEIAATFREMFLAEFLKALECDPLGELAYPGAYSTEGLVPEAARETGLLEWEDWINGGYGVCLRRFDALGLVTKAGGTVRIREITYSGTRSTLSPAERLELIEVMERLDAVMLPFAPHQRPKGTPGLWIDTPLARYGMGKIPLVESLLLNDSDALRCA